MKKAVLLSVCAFSFIAIVVLRTLRVEPQIEDSQLPVTVTTPLLQGAELSDDDRNRVLRQVANSEIYRLLKQQVSSGCFNYPENCNDGELLAIQNEIGRISIWAGTQSLEVSTAYNWVLDCCYRNDYLTAMAKREFLKTVPRPPGAVK